MVTVAREAGEALNFLRRVSKTFTACVCLLGVLWDERALPPWDKYKSMVVPHF